MCDKVNSNPFAGLFSTVSDAVSFSSQHQILLDERKESIDNSQKAADSPIDSNISEDSLKEQRLQRLTAEVFCITLQEKIKFKHDKPLVYIDTDSIEQAVFERLMLTNPSSKLVNKVSKDGSVDQHTLETRVIVYLFECFSRLKTYERNNDLANDFADIRRIILRNVGTALQEPDFYERQEVIDIKTGYN